MLERRLGWLHCAAETVRSRHNVSASLRSCDAFGIQHVHLVGETFTATRGASRGAERWMTVHTHETTADAITALKSRGLKGVRMIISDACIGLADAAAERAENRDEIYAVLRECAAGLTDLQRKALHQRYYEESPVKKIASAWGKTQMAVYKVLNRVHESLASCMRAKLGSAST